MAQSQTRETIDTRFTKDSGYYDESGNFIPPSNNQAANQNYQPSENSRNSQIRNVVTSFRNTVNRNPRVTRSRLTPMPLPGTPANADTEPKENSLTATTEDGVAHVKAAGITAEVFAWVGWWWLFVVVPFGLLSVVSLGIAGYLDDPEGVIGNVIGAAGQVISSVASVFGIDFLNWTALFMMTWIIVWTVYLFCLAAATLQYSLAGLHPLGGKGAGLKTSTFMFAVVASFIPVANLIPWIFLWVAAVFYYPK